MNKILPTPQWALPGNARWAWWCWEPIDHYRRSGLQYAPNGSEWLEDWYQMIHDKNTVKMMADLGVNIAVTHYFKGMGIDFEKPEMERTAKLAEICHKYGIRVIGYTAPDRTAKRSIF
jgi:hypothetical protein